MRWFKPRGSLCTPHGKKMADRKSKTLFVRNLPFSTSNEKLAETFEHVGPIKTAFVVADKESGKCRGYGYVQFSMLEDAAKALSSVTHCEGRKISLAYANAKKSLKERRKKITPQQDEDDTGSGADEKDSVAEAAKKPKLEKSTVPTHRPRKEASVKRCRLIVRNLAFKCQEKDLKAQFQKFGDISEVVIPLKNGSLSRGFAFIQFTKVQAAQKAVAEINGKKIMGRPVAVDWAVAKDRFEANNEQDSDKDSGVSEEEGESDDNDNAEEEENESDDEEKEDDSDEDEEEDESDDEDESENGDASEEESGEESDGSDSASSPVTDKKPAFQRKSDVEEGRTLFVRNIPFEAEEEEVEEAFGEFGETSYVRLMTDKTTGHPKGTAFVQFKRKDDADECLAKTQSGDRDGAIVIQGRTLVVTLAISRTEAQGMQVAKKSKEEKDNRNLFLAREGMIRAGTQAAIGLSQEDLNKRLKIEQAKREKLKNQNVFVSSTRLCIHNLPTKVNENELRRVLRQTVEDPAMRITECRVMRDLTRNNQQGVSKSLGYAFVNFSTHEHALKALRELNNSTIFDEKKRPIVEFSLENRKALEAKEKRMVKSKALSRKKKEEEANEATSGIPAPAKTAAGKRKAQQKSNHQAKKTKLDKTQDVIARSMHSGPKGLPKRMGPKIRHKKRGKGDNPGPAQKDKKKKKKFQHNRPQQQPQPKMMKRKRKQQEMTDNVDKLINKHKAKKARMFKS